jgi:hypothetical protein
MSFHCARGDAGIFSEGWRRSVGSRDPCAAAGFLGRVASVRDGGAADAEGWVAGAKGALAFGSFRGCEVFGRRRVRFSGGGRILV